MLKQTLALVVIASSLTMVGAPAVYAADEVNVVPGLSAINAPLGLHGADPVALLGGQNIRGASEHAAAHNGVAYYFASAESKAKFEANPARYIPANGGFCTFGVSVGKKFDGDPRFATVVDGQLYVFLNQGTLDAFNKDVASNIAKAEENWQQIEHIAATDL